MLKNDFLLFETNMDSKEKRIYFKNGYVVYKNTEKYFSGVVINDIICFVNTLHRKYPNINFPISFEFGKIIFADKLTYIFFEIICSILINDYRHNVYVKFENETNILTEGLESSPLLLLKTGEKQHLKKFVCKFQKEFYNKHYRQVFSLEDMQGDKLCKIMDDIGYFLKFFDIVDESIYQISEVIIELIGNVKEHVASDCLVDLDVTNPYRKRESEGIFFGINLTIVNFSKELFYIALKEKILNCNETLNERHTKVYDAYNTHKAFFDKNYIEEDFFNIASFQHKISGNENKKVTGGTGLTKLIYSLEEKSDDHMCYMISGNRVLWFRQKYMEYNEDNWIGFNKEKDFFTTKPDEENFGDGVIYMPGTAFNLNFVMERKNSDEK